MGRKGMSPQERREYERLQQRKKRQIERRRGRGTELEDTGRSVSDRGRSGNRRRRRREKREKNIFGNILLILQAVVSAVFLGLLLIANVVPLKYLAVITVCLLVLWGIGFLSQVKRKKRGAAGKVYMIFITLLLFVGTYYVGKVTGAMGKVTGSREKIDTMVVAVLTDDPANSLTDAADYTFGVQYTMNGDDVKKTMNHVNETIGTDVKTKEYNSVSEQAKALHDKKVKAIVYNEGYKSVLEEEFHGYSDKVKIIFKYDIKTELKNLTIDVAVKNEPFSVYLSGIDVYGSVSKTSRSDVNIIAVVNPTTRQILLVTTPRDYYVEIPGISKGQKDKLTHAGLYGVDASMKTLGRLYDLDIPFYARINFTSMIEIVDTLGGVDVDSEYAFKTGSASGKVMRVSKGMNHFNGKEALAFSRERKNLADGDNQRGKNQQAVITAMIKKMISPSMLVKASSIIDSLSGNVETNMSQEQLQSLIKMQLSEGGSWNIYSVAAEGTGAKNTCYSSGSAMLYVTKPDYESVAKIKDLIRKVQDGEVLEGSVTTE